MKVELDFHPQQTHLSTWKEEDVKTALCSAGDGGCALACSLGDESGADIGTSACVWMAHSSVYRLHPSPREQIDRGGREGVKEAKKE